jgi:curved DNA-binding protein CbpA
MRLYGLLGILPNSSVEEIRAAYRKLAKSAHPDIVGGSTEAFETLKTAQDVLTDPERRARYDATGEIVPSKADNAFAEIMTIVSGAFDVACQNALKAGRKVTEIDLLDEMRQALQARRAELANQIKESAEAKHFLEPLLGRFSNMLIGEENHLEAVIRAKLVQADEIAARMKADIERIGRAKELLLTYSYRIDGSVTKIPSQWVHPQSFLDDLHAALYQQSRTNNP